MGSAYYILDKMTADARQPNREGTYASVEAAVARIKQTYQSGAYHSMWIVDHNGAVVLSWDKVQERLGLKPAQDSN